MSSGSAAIIVHDNGYQAGQRMSPRGRMLAGLVVVGLHLGGFAALLQAKPAPPPVEPVLMQVTMIAEAPVMRIEPPAPPPKKEPPKPQARLVATAKPAPSAIVAPPPEVEPVTEAVALAATPPAPPAAPAPSPPAEPAPEQEFVPPDFVAAYLNNPPPVYPYAARQRRETGEVRLRVLVLANGTAGDVKIEKSSGSSSLDNAARDVVFKRWRFVPARRGDEAVEAWVIVPLLFELKG